MWYNVVVWLVRGPDYDPVYLQISTDRDNPIALTSAPASDMNFYNPRYSLHLTSNILHVPDFPADGPAIAVDRTQVTSLCSNSPISYDAK